MKIRVMGYRGLFNSTERIESELVKLGHELVESEPDLLIHLTGKFGEAEEFYNSCQKKPIRLYCLLDIDTNKPISWYDDAKKDLENCEIPCVISNVVREQVKGLLDIKKELNILRYPIRPISYLNYQKTYDFLYVGRVYSPNKRFGLIKEVFDYMNYPTSRLIVAGTEKPPFGYYVEKPLDGLLNEIYNCARYTFLLSDFEGTGLSCVESLVAGSFPILCKDNAMVYELGLDDFAAEPNPKSIVEKIMDIKENEESYKEMLDEVRPKLEEQFKVENVAKRIIELYDRAKTN